MSVAEGVCDYCGRDRLLDTGDERSVMNPGRTLWCGTCREGSKRRFSAFNDETLAKMRRGCELSLERDPIRWDDKDNPETLEERAIKLDWSDEAWRITRELAFRRRENQ